MDTKTTLTRDPSDTRTKHRVGRRVVTSAVTSAVTSHQLARLLLGLPELPICVSAHGAVYSERMSGSSHGPLMIGVLESYAGDHVIIGNMLEHANNGRNWKIKEILYNGRADRPEVSVSEALRNVRDQFTNLRCPAVMVKVVERIVKFWPISEGSDPGAIPGTAVVTMNDTDQILADLAEVL